MSGGLIILMIISPVMEAAIIFSTVNKFIMVRPYKAFFTICQRDFMVA